MQQTLIGCIQQLSGSSNIWTIRCYWPCSGPDTPVTKLEAADLVHCFPDDLVSQRCIVFEINSEARSQGIVFEQELGDHA